jgi:hypothetical protein
VAITHTEEVEVLEATEVRDGDPGILVSLFRVAWSHACLSCKSKLSHTICMHLFRVSSLEIKLTGLRLLLPRLGLHAMILRLIL